MKYKIIFILLNIIILLTGCSISSSLYTNGVEELENGNYEKAIEYFSEYQRTYDDAKPLIDSYCQYADFLYNNSNYIYSLHYYKLANELDPTDNTISDNITKLTDTIYNIGIEFLDNNQELLAFQYLYYIKDDIDNDLIPEEPLLGIWKFDNNYIKLTKSSISYLYGLNINHVPTDQDFTEDSILILGDWYINDEGNIGIDDNVITHHNEHYLNYIEIIDNDTIYINGNNTLTGEYKRR